MFFKHFKAAVFSIIAGWLENISGGFQLAFNVAGVSQIFAAVMMLLNYCHLKYKAKYKEVDQKESFTAE